MGFSRQENWSGLPFPPPRDLPDPGIKPMSLALADGFFTGALPVELMASVASFNLILPQFHPLEKGNCPQPPVCSRAVDLVLLVMIFICC